MSESNDSQFDFEIDMSRPTHLNLCFDEPLLPDLKEVEELLREEQKFQKIKSKWLDSDFVDELTKKKDRNFANFWHHQGLDSEIDLEKKLQPQDAFYSFCKKIRSPLVILGPMEGERAQRLHEPLKSILMKWKLPIYAEATSNLRNDKDLGGYLIKSAEELFKSPNLKTTFDSVIRIGQIPTCRLWRDLEDKLKTWPVLNFTHLPFSGLSRDEVWTLPLSSIFELNFSRFETHTAETKIQEIALDTREDDTKNSFDKSLKPQEPLDIRKLQDKPFTKTLSESGTLSNQSSVTSSDDNSHLQKIELQSKKLQNKDLQKNELAWIKFLSENIPQNSRIFLGNSLPIREWDQASVFEDRDHKFFCNRGANGIDGLISTSLGLTEKHQSTWAIVGDLSTLYDLNALHALKYSEGTYYLVVINNGGGKIFTPMFHDDRFENQHQHNFKSMAEMFGLDYKVFKETKTWEVPTSSALIEIQI